MSKSMWKGLLARRIRWLYLVRQQNVSGMVMMDWIPLKLRKGADSRRSSIALIAPRGKVAHMRFFMKPPRFMKALVVLMDLFPFPVIRQVILILRSIR